MRALLLTFLALTACTQAPPTSKDSSDADASSNDADGDGFSVEEGDCDDAAAEVNPAASERCDGIDQDCDDVVDNGVLATFYADSDQDGFGDANAPVEACELPAGHVATGSDCDDADASVFPLAEEVCDGVDQDCDGTADDGVLGTWYTDSDGDGFGDPGAPLTGCDVPADGVEDATDCDDARADSFPGNAEACDEVDNDCDGVVDDGVTSPWYADLDGDGHGRSDLSQEACTQPTGYAPLADDCDDDIAGTFPGAIEVCNGEDDDCDGTADDGAADAIAWYTDADGDGVGVAPATYACDAPGATSARAGDCDDLRATSFPGAPETCNGTDDDCDGAADEADATDATTWYLDYDGDGYGGTRFSVTACAPPAGYVANADDCDDATTSRSPVASETCNGTDDDCDGATDEGLTLPTWYADRDSDGWGDSASSTPACSAPSGHVGRAGDCNDGTSAVSPSAAESCNGVDDDCDGVVDDGTPDSDGDGLCDARDTETCDGLDNDGDGLGDEGLTCTYRLTQADLGSNLCVDDDLYVQVDGVAVYNDASVRSAGCDASISFTARPGQTITAQAYDSVGGCRSLSEVWIVNVAGGVGRRLSTGYSGTCGHSASGTPFWTMSVAVPGLF